MHRVPPHHQQPVDLRHSGGQVGYALAPYFPAACSLECPSLTTITAASAAAPVLQVVRPGMRVSRHALSAGVVERGAT